MTPQNRQFAGWMVWVFFFLREARSRAATPRSHGFDANKGKGGRGTGREDAIDDYGRRGAGAAAFSWPSCHLGGRFSPPLPWVEEIGLREATPNCCPECLSKPDRRRRH